ncbi:MAG: DUF4864 domain-containing protein [Opitutaceae bacterium]|nr:DUF4864 domain-containing protein [Opitutaceae bacterium]
MLLLRFLVVGLLPAAAAWAADLRASRPEVRKQIVAVIDGQLEAFRRGEPERAYGYATAAFRAQRSLTAFVAIVRGSYPEIWANTRAEPGIVRDDGTRATVTVQVSSKTGDAAYDSTLAKEEAGWRIRGVVRHEPSRGKRT